MEEIKNNRPILSIEELSREVHRWIIRSYKIIYNKAITPEFIHDQGMIMFKKAIMYYDIHEVAKEMNKRVIIRMRRDILILKFKRSDNAALRIFADQLKLVKY